LSPYILIKWRCFSLNSIPGFKFIRVITSRLLGVKSARGVSFALAMLSMASKPMGYARTLIIAWAFGTSPGMDSFHLASGIIALFTGSIAHALESSVLPELVRIREETGDYMASKNVAAFISCILLFATAMLVAALIIAPGMLIRFFASGFDSGRIKTGAVMLWWLAPFAVVTVYKPMLDIWANFTERYTLSSVVSTLFNFLAIPALLAAIPLIGAYSVAFSISFAHILLFLITIAMMRGIPLFWRRKDIPCDSLLRIAGNSAYVVAIAASSTLYVIVDRYFASMLPSGSVAAISYAMTLSGVMSAIVNTPMMFFLSKISRLAAADRDEARKMLDVAIALAMAYLIPASAFVIVSSKPIVSLIFGWGSFNSNSVETTAICLASYSIGFSFSIAAVFIYRYAQATRRLGTIVLLSYALVAVNGLLDWALVTKWGLLGLTLATSFTQILGFILYYLVILGRSLPGYIWRMKLAEQTATAALFAFAAHLAGTYGDAAGLASSFLLFFLCLTVSERLGFIEGIPLHWSPSKLAGFIFAAMKSYIHSK